MSETRRPVRSRRVKAFHMLATALVRVGFTPNAVSAFSAVFAALGALSLFAGAHAHVAGAKFLALFGAFLGIQLRLVCNLVDGLMAVEGGKKTAYGELFNDFPDRLSDIFLLLASGYAVGAGTLGWIAAVLAVLTAYIRVLGASMGTPPYFLGPMAKQHRMAVLNLALLGSALEIMARGDFRDSFLVALWLVILGCVLTCVRRARAVVKYLGGPRALP